MFFYLVFSEIHVRCLKVGNLTNVDCLLLVSDSCQIQDVSINSDAFLHYQIAPVQTGPGAHLASYTMRTGSFSGVKRPGGGVEHHPYLVPREEKETAPLGLSDLFWVNFNFTFSHYQI